MATIGEDGSPAPGDAPSPGVAAAAAACLATLFDEPWPRANALAGLCALASLAERAAAAGSAAAILGERWVEDVCSFADVTLGLHRLTLLLLDVEAGLAPARLHGGRVMLAAAPEDQHGFGLAMVAMALRAGGWDVSLDLSGDEAALVAAARAGVDCIGLSVGHDRALAPVAALVRRLRATAPAALIAVGGPMRSRVPDLAGALGADLSVADGFALAATLADRRLAHAA